MNYLVIDLEMCKVPKNYRGKNYKYASEIIQVGAVLLDEDDNITSLDEVQLQEDELEDNNEDNNNDFTR